MLIVYLLEKVIQAGDSQTGEGTSILKAVEKFEIAKKELCDVRKDFQSGRLTKIIMTGMGSSYFSTLPSLMHLNKGGILACSISACELKNYLYEMIDKNTLLILVSQSGESVETIKVLEKYNNSGLTISITTDKNNFLSRNSDIAIETAAGYEESVSSKTYTNSLVMLYLIANLLLNKDIGMYVSNIEKVSGLIADNLDKWKFSTESIVDKMIDPKTHIGIILANMAQSFIADQF